MPALFPTSMYCMPSAGAPWEDGVQGAAPLVSTTILLLQTVFVRGIVTWHWKGKEPGT